MDKAYLYKDVHYYLALIAAPVVWLILYIIDHPQINMDWLQKSPWLFLMLVVVRPVLEELFFRGFLQDLFDKYAWARCHFGCITYSNTLTSSIFVMMHLIYHVPLMALAVFIPSLIFGYFRDRYEGWLVPCILLHCFYNLGYFLLYALD